MPSGKLAISTATLAMVVAAARVAGAQATPTYPPTWTPGSVQLQAGGLVPPPPMTPGPATPPPQGVQLQAGGLVPPPPMTLGPAPPPPQGVLEEPKHITQRRRLEWIWLNVEGGFEQIGLSTFDTTDQTYGGFLPTSAGGPVIGAGIGARAVFFTLGVRGRMGFFSDYKLYSVGGELGFHIPLGVFEPHFEAGAGYATLGDVGGPAGDAGMTAHGYYLRIGAGLDYYLTPYVTVGLNLSTDILGLTRPGLTGAQIAKLQAEPGLTTTQITNAALLAQSGSSNGSTIVIDALVGLHF